MLIVHEPEGRIEFICHPWRLNYLDLSNSKNVGIMLPMTVKEPLNGYSKAQIEGAIKACHLEGLIGHP